MRARFAAALLFPCALSAAGVAQDAPQPSWALLAPMGLTDIQHMAVEGRMLYAAGDSGIFRSEDYGRSWKQVHREMTYGLAVNGIRIYAGCGRSVYRSADHGADWRDITEKLHGSDPQASFRFNSFAFEGHFLFAGTLGEGIFRSGDYGESWSPIGKEPDNPIILCLFGAGNRVLAGTTLETYGTEDHGNSWVPGNKSLSAVKAFARHAGRFYAATFQNGIYQSQDEARIWKHADAGLDAEYAYVLYEARGVLYSGTSEGVWRFSDREGKWSRFGTGLGGEIADVILCEPNLYAAGLDGRIYCMGPKCPVP